MNRKNMEYEITEIFSLNDFTDYDSCEKIFNCMSPENQEKFIKKYGYEDLGYAYDDNRELAYDLVYAMNDEELNKCYKLAKDLENAEEW